MNRLFFVLVILFSTNVYSANLTLPHHLICETSLSKYDSNVKESYDIKIIGEYSNGIVLNIDGESLVLTKNIEKDGSVFYYSETPWYNFKIDAPEMKNKYSLGIPTNEPFARYTSCKEVE
jgi:hypothetical protein